MSSLRPLTVELESKEFDPQDLQVEKLRGWERISKLFWFELTVVVRGAATPTLRPGADVTVVLRRETPDSQVEERRVHGVLFSVHDRLDTARRHRTYVLRVVPHLEQLKLVATQEVFLSQTVREVVERKLELHDLGSTSFVFHHEELPKRELVVQYKESDLDFVSRLLEHLGISFVFKHDDAGTQVVFSDDLVNSVAFEGLDEIPYQGQGVHEDVFELEVERHMFPSTFIVQDYNYRTPLSEISAVHALEAEGGERIGNGGGIVEYGSHHKNKDEGGKLAQIRAEEQRAASETYFGKSHVFALTAGASPKITGHPELGDKRLLVVEVEHSAEMGDVAAGIAGSYENTFKAVDAALRFRPPRTTPRPRIHGLVTGNIALGSGQPGGLARLDEEGRYVVQLHFDTVAREGEERASHPIRMSQPFAGPNHGFHFPLRPGTEVIVAFLDGDPDRPIIVGSVPNAINRATTTAANAMENRVQTASGIVFKMTDNR